MQRTLSQQCTWGGLTPTSSLRWRWKVRQAGEGEAGGAIYGAFWGMLRQQPVASRSHPLQVSRQQGLGSTMQGRSAESSWPTGHQQPWPGPVEKIKGQPVSNAGSAPGQDPAEILGQQLFGLKPKSSHRGKHFGLGGRHPRFLGGAFGQKGVLQLGPPEPGDREREWPQVTLRLAERGLPPGKMGCVSYFQWEKKSSMPPSSQRQEEKSDTQVTEACPVPASSQSYGALPTPAVAR